MIESEYILQARAGIVAAQGGVMSHPEADIKNASGILKSLYAEILSSIPYMTGGLGPGEVANKEREEAVAMYEAYRKSVLGERPGYIPLPEPEKIEIRSVS